LKKFIEIGNQNTRFRFLYTFDASAAKEFGLDDGQSHVILKRDSRFVSKKEDARLIFGNKNGENSLEEWFDDNILSPVDIYDEKTVSVYERKKQTRLTLLFNVDWDNKKKQTIYYINRLKKLANDYPGKLLFTFGNIVDFAPLAQKMGLTKDMHAIITDKDYQNYLFDKEVTHKDKFNMGDIKEFIDDYLAGKLIAHVKSQPIPEQDKDDVKVVVGRTFNSIVNNPKKDVLIEFYAPWCTHCKAIDPVYSELATKFRDVKDLVIAKFDATVNDYPKEFEVKGFPSFYFVSKDNKMMPYKGGRQLNDFIEFLQPRTSIGKREEL